MLPCGVFSRDASVLQHSRYISISVIGCKYCLQQFCNILTTTQ